MGMEFTIPPENGAVSFRRFVEDDIMLTYTWVSNPWYTGDFAGSAAPTLETHLRYFEGVLVDKTQVFLAVCADGKHIGNAGLKYFDGDTCECWYYIGDEGQRGKGYAREIVRLLCLVAFSIDGIDRVKARVLQTNARSSRALLSNGFLEDAILEDGVGRKFVMYVKVRCGFEDGLA